MKKLVTLMLSVVGFAVMATGCGKSTVQTSAQATKEQPLELTLAHNLSETHTTSVALQEFADEVNEKTEGRIKINIFPNGQLGSETEVLEQLMADVVDMTRVSGPGLATYNEGYHAFGLPYLFNDTESYYKVMDSQAMHDFFLSSKADGFLTLGYYTSGSRSFYTVDKPIRTPADLKGMKFRVQDMKSQTDMIKALGGTPVAMASGDVYTSIQTGIIDGAESNETVLTIGKHGEICKYFSLDEHTMIPDMLVIGDAVWDKLSEADQKIFLEAADHSTQDHKIKWAQDIDASIEEAKTTMGVTFVEDVDKEAFREATKEMIEEYCVKYPKVAEVINIINSVE